MDFTIEWPPNTPDINTSPATENEIVDALFVVRNQIKHLQLQPKNRGVVSLRIRAEVAEAVADGINASKTAYAVVSEKEFDFEKGIYESILYVAKDEDVYTNYWI